MMRPLVTPPWRPPAAPPGAAVVLDGGDVERRACVLLDGSGLRLLVWQMPHNATWKVMLDVPLAVESCEALAATISGARYLALRARARERD